MSSGHLIAGADLAFLRDVNADRLVDAGIQLVAILPCKDLGVYNNPVLTVRNLQRGISHLSCLLSENSAKQLLFRRQLCLSLGGNLSHQNITGANFRADANDTVLIQILEGLISDAGNISGNLFRSQLRVTGLRLIFLDMDGCVDIVLDQVL